MEFELEKSVLATIIYFDIFDYPLTLIEIHRFFLDLNGSEKHISLDKIRNSLHRSVFFKNKIRFNDGFFYLRGRDKILSNRHHRYIVAKRKFDYALKIINMLKHIPFVRAIFISNSLAYNNTKKTSDIDLLIVTKKYGVWWTRLFSLLLLSIMRVRPGHKNAKNKICLSVFVDENHLDFSNLRVFDRDIDFLYWVCNFYPIYDEQGLYQKFYKINKKWFEKKLINFNACISHPNRVITHSFFIRGFVEFILQPFNIFAAIIQKAKFPKQIQELVNKDTRVRVENGLLKFHVNDRRIKHLEKFMKKYEAIIAR